MDLAATPTYAQLPLAYLAQGSFHTSDKLGSSLHGGYKETVKSKGINPKYVSSFYYVAPKTPVQHILMVKPGTNCTNIACDTTYRLRVDVKGSPALRFLTHNLYQTVDAYSGCCDTLESNIDPMVLLLQWKERINESLILKDFVNAKVWNKIAATGTTSATTTPTTTSASFGLDSYTGVVEGQYVTGTNIPAGSKVTTVNGTTSITITYPEVAVAPVTADFNDKNNLVFYTEVTTAFSAYTPVTSNNDEDVNDCFITLTGAYSNTNFLDCSFSPMDHVEYQPIEIYASVVEQTDIPCDTVCFGKGGVVTAPTSAVLAAGTAGAYVLQQAKQGNGFGETIVRELILSNRYMQEPWQQDPRLREVLDDTTLSSGITRGNRYGAYYILHSVPRKSNPSGTLDADQYLIKIPVSARSTGAGSFESFMNAWLAAAGSEVSCQVL